ncbi:MAG: imidazole glycerol phosphate synthase subunit HisH [Candidatus Riflebacteria bacterium]|nr:imidazole glycerol phosphate synthase subunit HisH [Candidatus Riflebacteria bacterium]
MIVVVDCGIGNCGSVVNMIRRVGGQVVATADPAVVRSASRLVLPGVGSFDRGMTLLDEVGLLPVLNDRVVGAGVPILGICLGLQLMSRRSDEGARSGLGWLGADTVRFHPPAEEPVRIPHMGWNEVVPARETRLFKPVDGELRYYFAHSYHLVCDRRDDVLATSVHGYEFAAAVQRGNVCGVQFHPEKSHVFGMELMKSFVTGAAPC